MIKAFIINYNRLELPARMADWLAQFVEPIIVDNGSDYPPLLEYYETTPHRVHRLEHNYGHAVIWRPETAILDYYDLHGDYIVTDPDLIVDHIPNDWLDLLREALRLYPHIWKAGFSLRISDLPDTVVGNAARSFEAGYWTHPMPDPRFYGAPIDTTFALYRARMQDLAAVRTAPPYDAIHIPWYYSPENPPPEDELYYIQSRKAEHSTYWSERIKEAVSA